MRRPNRTIVAALSLLTASSAVSAIAFDAPRAAAAREVNGPVWSITSTAGANGIALVDVSCPATTSCFAVGYTDSAAVVDHWNGRHWSEMGTPYMKGVGHTWLNAVSCPNPNSCFAVGGTEVRHALIERWDGTRWSIMTSPISIGASSVSLESVSCSRPNSCGAVGVYTTGTDTGHVLSERWDGHQWSDTTSARPSVGIFTVDGLSGVACPTATSCFAVAASFNHGAFMTYVEHWNGTVWSTMTSPNVTSDTELSDISCPSATSCFAIGRSLTSSTMNALVERWNRTDWSIVPGLAAGKSELFGISCRNTSSCMAVGDSTVGSSTQPLAEQWNGTHWSTIATAKLSGNHASLYKVACPAKDNCMAVGESSGTVLAEHYG